MFFLGIFSCFIIITPRPEGVKKAFSKSNSYYVDKIFYCTYTTRITDTVQGAFWK